MIDIDLAIIGGSGLYELPGLTDMAEHAPVTPFGPASDSIRVGSFGGLRLAFLARHGRHHHLLPHRVNYRANTWALHHLGARAIIGVNAVGGIRTDMGPRAVVIPDQIIDYTHGRMDSFCDVEGAAVHHVDFSEPYTADLRVRLLTAAARAGVDVVDGGCYGATQGPRLETRAEIARMRRDGCDLVGMTGMPEAVLARELGVAYASLSLVANWAAGCDPDAQPEISVEAIFQHLKVASARVPDIFSQWV